VELGSYLLFLQEQIKDIIIKKKTQKLAVTMRLDVLMRSNMHRAVKVLRDPFCVPFCCPKQPVGCDKIA
jgi:hypothetical protein